ncbi:G-protein coupled receptor [Xylariales sp. AK1849]|nr:G-protein coupled receptor [Xylariales sp. AK1849]
MEPGGPALFSKPQLEAISTIERVCSVLSLLGCVFIIFSFSTSKAFHKPINRLVFYASFGNMMTNVATLIAREYLESEDSVGCQFQAFLVQMFMPADALWTLAMAVNVYLTFYFKYDAEKLRKMEVWYFILCYGIPLIPALTFIFVSNQDQGRVYGDATLWCWVRSSWDIFRIATFYGPVWVVIVVTFFIYLRAGGDIYQKRKQMRYFSSSHDPEPLTMDDPSSSKTTEVMVTTEDASGQEGIDLTNLGRDGAEACSSQPPPGAAYSVTISSSVRDDRHSRTDLSPPIQSNVVIREPAVARQGRRSKRRANFEVNNAAWSYTKCAILFFTAILITWIPSSANRVYSVVHPGEVSTPLEFMSAIVLPLQGFWNAVIYITTSWSACKYFFSELGDRTRRRGSKTFTSDYDDKRTTAFRIPNLGTRKNYETDSTTELANDTRPNSNDDPKLRM